MQSHDHRLRRCVNVFRPRSVGEGQGRAWYPVWNAGSTYAMPAEIGAKMVSDGKPFSSRPGFKDGYGPVGAWFLFFKAQAPTLTAKITWPETGIALRKSTPVTPIPRAPACGTMQP